MNIGLLFTLCSGLFFLIGIISNKFIKEKKRFSLFTISLASIVLIGLLFFDLIPEILEEINLINIILIFTGFILLLIIDKFIPHHHHHHELDDCKEVNIHDLHLDHIGIITIIALAIHNMIEGISLYNLSLISISSATLMLVSVALHNIPLGFQIGSSLNNSVKSKILTIFLCISALIGSILYIIFGNIFENIEMYILSLTSGMLIYILIFEFISEIIFNIKRKEVLIGFLIGLLFLLTMILI